MKVYVLIDDNGACGDPECCGPREVEVIGVTISKVKAEEYGDYKEFTLDECK